MKIKLNAGFTLIEIITAMTILAILSVIAFSSFSSIQKTARDLVRKERIKQLQGALELYYQKNGHYPISCNTGVCGDITQVGDKSTDNPPTHTNWLKSIGASSAGIPDPPMVPDYIDSLPIDPINTYYGLTSPDNKLIGYTSSRVNYWGSPSTTFNCPVPGQWYALATYLENPSDNDSGTETQLFCDGTTKVGDIQIGTSAYIKDVPSFYVVVVEK